MSKRLSLFISVVFHPIFVNLLGFVLLMKLFPYLDYVMGTQARLFYLTFIFVSTAVVPLLYVLAMKLFGQVHSMMLESAEERRGPYVITAVMCLFDFYFFQRTHTPALINAFLLGMASIVVALLIINHFNKISIHMASFGMLTAVVVSAAQAGGFDVRLVLIPVIVATGLTAAARLFANAHSLQQLLSGYLLGFAIMFFVL